MAAPGIPPTIQVSGRCTSTGRLRRAKAAAPRLPSLPMPVRINGNGLARHHRRRFEQQVGRGMRRRVGLRKPQFETAAAARRDERVPAAGQDGHLAGNDRTTFCAFAHDKPGILAQRVGEPGSKELRHVLGDDDRRRDGAERLQKPREGHWPAGRYGDRDKIDRSDSARGPGCGRLVHRGTSLPAERALPAEAGGARPRAGSSCAVRRRCNRDRSSSGPTPLRRNRRRRHVVPSSSRLRQPACSC